MKIEVKVVETRTKKSDNLFIALAIVLRLIQQLNPDSTQTKIRIQIETSLSLID